MLKLSLLLIILVFMLQNEVRNVGLKDKVCEMLQVKNIELFSPPRETSDPNMPLTGVDAFIFPAWFVAQV